jgi:hypothetical protein
MTVEMFVITIYYCTLKVFRFLILGISMLASVFLVYSFFRVFATQKSSVYSKG